MRRQTGTNDLAITRRFDCIFDKGCSSPRNSGNYVTMSIQFGINDRNKADDCYDRSFGRSESRESRCASRNTRERKSKFIAFLRIKGKIVRNQKRDKWTATNHERQLHKLRSLARFLSKTFRANEMKSYNSISLIDMTIENVSEDEKVENLCSIPVNRSLSQLNTGRERRSDRNERFKFLN